MKERPILFSGAMVRAILAGTKTQTRRVIKPQPDCAAQPAWLYGDEGHSGAGWYCVEDEYREEGSVFYRFPYGTPGDRLWVRETWCGKLDPVTSQLMWHEDGETYDVHYDADGYDVRADDGDGYTRLRKDGSEASPWRPSIHMPRWASRITLEVISVRPERLQDITEDDARAEGKRPVSADASYRAAFSLLWDSINAKRGYPWDENPWVWRIEFRRAA